jgi:phage terminase small subunit
VTNRKGEIVKVPYIHFKPSDEVDGTLIQEVKIGRDGVSLKLYDKQKAMQELIKLLGGDELRQAQIAKLKALSNVDAPSEIEDDGFIDALNQKGAELWQSAE